MNTTVHVCMVLCCDLCMTFTSIIFEYYNIIMYLIVYDDFMRHFLCKYNFYIRFLFIPVLTIVIVSCGP